MARYQIWNKTDSIITPGYDPVTKKCEFTPEEWLERYPWAKIPGAKMIITAGPINGGCAEYFDNFVAIMKRQGAAIVDGMTDDEVLAAIEDFEDNPPQSNEASLQERTAAALEFLAMNSLPDEV